MHGLRVRAFGTDDQPRVGALSRPARAVAKPAFKVLFRARIEGLANVPHDGPAILSANHRSFFDTPLIMGTAPRPVIFLGKAEYMNSWTTKFLFPAVGMVPIKRDVAKASVAALATAAELLNEGKLVGIYPEGTRSRDGFLHRGQSGVAQLALTTGAPIIPIGLIGTQRVQPIGRAVPRPFRGPVRVRFGAPIRPQDYQAGNSRKRRQHMVNDVMAAIAALTDQTRSNDFASHRPPLIRGGSEAVYRVSYHRSDGLNWRHAIDRAVAAASTRYDDARVAEVRALECRLSPTGEFRFGVEIALSTKYLPTPSPGGTP